MLKKDKKLKLLKFNIKIEVIKIYSLELNNRKIIIKTFDKSNA